MDNQLDEKNLAAIKARLARHAGLTTFTQPKAEYTDNQDKELRAAIDCAIALLERVNAMLAQRRP